jgi:predicted RNase H-like nuclease
MRWAIRSFAELKRYEDGLDALLCAWVGIKYLDGDVVAYGDDTAAIWVSAAVAPQAGARSKQKFD